MPKETIEYRFLRGKPEPVRVSETGRARNWTIPPLRPERECREHSAEQNDLVSFCERRKFTTASLLEILTGGKEVVPSVDETANAAFRDAFVLAGDWTTKNVTEGITPPCHREERANASDVAIHWRTLRFNGIATHPADARNDARVHAAFTVADRQSRLHNGLVGSRSAFTMAEILLSLTIIGVVAAITLPSLTGNINERTWNTQRKALYARFSQAVSLIPALNGYGVLEEGDPNNVAETFITDGLAKVLKINNICDKEHLPDCGVASKITPLNGTENFSMPTTLAGLNSMFDGFWQATTDDGTPYGSQYHYHQTDTNAAAFETQNGESVVVYYNPLCIMDMNQTQWHHTQPKMCANFIYDLNGNKGPNSVGKDVGFITVLYASDPIVVSPMPIPNGDSSQLHPFAEIGSICRNKDETSRMPNIDELAAMFYNRKLLGITGGIYWSASLRYDNSTRAWAQNFNTGHRIPPVAKGDDAASCQVICVKR